MLTHRPVSVNCCAEFERWGKKWPPIACLVLCSSPPLHIHLTPTPPPTPLSFPPHQGRQLFGLPPVELHEWTGGCTFLPNIALHSGDSLPSPASLARSLALHPPIRAFLQPRGTLTSPPLPSVFVLFSHSLSLWPPPTPHPSHAVQLRKGRFCFLLGFVFLMTRSSRPRASSSSSFFSPFSHVHLSRAVRFPSSYSPFHFWLSFPRLGDHLQTLWPHVALFALIVQKAVGGPVSQLWHSPEAATLWKVVFVYAVVRLCTFCQFEPVKITTSYCWSTARADTNTILTAVWVQTSSSSLLVMRANPIYVCEGLLFCCRGIKGALQTSLRHQTSQSFAVAGRNRFPDG